MKETPRQFRLINKAQLNKFKVFKEFAICTTLSTSFRTKYHCQSRPLDSVGSKWKVKNFKV